MPGVDLDAMSAFVLDVVTETPKFLVSWYLVLSYAYYELDEVLVHDHVFDAICKELLKKIENFEIDHEHLHLVDPAMLEAGSGYGIKNYPTRVQSVARGFLQGFFTPYDL